MATFTPPTCSNYLNIFTSERLACPNGIDNALSELQTMINETNIAATLEASFDKPLIVELILSELCESTPIKRWILDKFPETFDEYKGSLESKLLSRLAVFFLFPPSTFSREMSKSFAEQHRWVTSAPAALEILSTLKFTIAEAEAEVGTHEFGLLEFPKVKGKSQKQLKREKRVNGKRNIDTKSFEILGISVPCDQEAADLESTFILSTLKSILESYLETIRLPHMAAAIKTSIIPRTETPAALKIDTKLKPSPPSEVPSEAIASAYPAVQPMKSALHFNSAEGFGEWRILISARADGDLREARRKDRKSFAIIVKKIKELSNGHFSDDNQKRLNGSNIDIPVFEAKMTRDSRLVYQVDSVSDYNSENEQQVIRVFGIYTHAQLDKRLWDSVGQQLGKKGKEYKRRCIYRKKPHHNRDKIFKPASFPPLEEVDDIPPTLLSNLPPDDLDQLHSLLVLEKYLTFSQELLYSILADLDVAFPFQVSPQERAIIEHPFSCYVLGRSGTGKTTTMLFKMLWIERTFQLNSSDMPKPRQLFVTKSRFLAVKVEEYFLKLLDSLKTASQSPLELRQLAQSRKKLTGEENLVDHDDEINWRGDLPTKFSELLDSHFPLFLTFDQLCGMIEADFNYPQSVHMQQTSRPKQAFISYEDFFSQYWPHFPQPLTKGLDPALVFSEIMGVIMGSEETTSSARGYLDRITYQNMSERTQATFATKRSVIYSIFESYISRKRHNGDVDAADRTHAILRVIGERGIMGQKLDQLYVDEAQDNLLVDALLLRSLCHNADGLFWAGDTAQTISVGSSFRFDDLKAFLFRIEKQQHQNDSHSTVLRYRTYKPPHTFQLATNYRSHAGIVDCAHSVIDLITKFWPYSIDTLAREKGIVDGIKPVFLNGWDTDNVRYEQFLFGSSGSHIEFGAQQCILVRDDPARDKLREQVGEIGLIMTLYESKGLEFNDVLLFNFFEDSTVDLSQWRVVLGAIETGQVNHVLNVPQFDELRHAGVCTELKFLYVAITRARKNLWIADCSEKGEPMRTFWTIRGQVQNCTPGADMPRLAVSSSAAEWAIKGKELFDRKKYLQARHCYERALMPREMAISQAYFLRDQARKTSTGEARGLKETRRNAFAQAAEAFYSCAEEAHKHKTIYYHNAGECFEAALENVRAAQAYVQAQEYEVGAKLYRKLGMFDEAVAVVKGYEVHMRTDVVDNIKDVARLYYFREQALEKAHALFDTFEEELEYLEFRDLDIARATLLCSLGRTAEAAELHLSEGRTLDAICLFLQDCQNERSMRSASKYILQELWRNLSFGVSNRNDTVMRLLDLSSTLDMSLLDSNDRDEIHMFLAITSGKQSKLATLGEAFFHANNATAAVLCLDHHFANSPPIKIMTVYELGNTLHLFSMYTRLLYDLAFHTEPVSARDTVRLLFGFQRLSEDQFFVPAQTFLFGHAHRFTQQTPLNEDLGLSLTGWELHQLFHKALCHHLRRRVSEENETCRKATAFSPCLTFAAFGFCNRVECPQEHTPPSALTIEWYNARIRIHYQQILIFQTVHSIEDPMELNRQRRYWINQLYEAVNPAFNQLGTPSNFDPNLIPELHRGIQVARDWVRELAYTLDFKPQIPFLTNLIRGASLAFEFDKKEASSYMFRSRSLTSSKKPTEYLRRPENEFTIEELMVSLEGSRDWSITAGILFVRHLVEHKLHINISALCDFIEHLCASTVVTNSCQRGGLHGVALPRSWLLRQISTSSLPAELAKRAPRIYWMLLDPMAALLEDIYTGVGAEYLLFNNQSIATIRSVRGVFITRICRALCFLGYNIRVFMLRNNILKVITSLRKFDHNFPPLYRPFVNAQHWDQLTRALRNSMRETSLDEMVKVHDLRQATAPLRPEPGVRLVLYSNEGDIPSLVCAHSAAGPSLISSSELNFLLPDAGTQVVQTPGDATDPPIDAEQTDIESDDQDHDLEVDGYLPTDMQASMPSAMPQALEIIAPSEDELHAASVIQQAYKRILLRRRRDMTKAGMSAARRRFFSICFDQSQEMTWKQNSYYRLLFLGPLPHILLCLDVAQAAILSQKKATKTGLLNNKHEELDELGAKLTELAVAYKTVLRLQKALGPSSELHVRCDLDELQLRVQESSDLIHGMASTHSEVREDLDIAMKGIVMRKKTKAKAPKPDLVWDDDFQF